MFDGQTHDDLGAIRPHAPPPVSEGWSPTELRSRRDDRGSEQQKRHDLPLSEPVRRLLHALAVYQVTRPEFGERVGRMGTLH